MTSVPVRGDRIACDALSIKENIYFRTNTVREKVILCV